MKIRQALNEIALNILLDKSLKWEKIGEFDSLSKNYSHQLKLGRFNFNISINRKVNGDEDIYYFNCMFNKLSGEMISICESFIKVPHHDLVITNVLTNDELNSFIELASTDASCRYWTQSFNYNDDLINYAKFLVASRNHRKEDSKVIN